MLEVTTLLYLFFPHIIFFFGWLTLFWAVYLTFLLGLLLIPTFQLALKDRALILNKNFVCQVLITLVVATAWTSLSGAGGWGLQSHDWEKHNAVLKELIQHSWPVAWSHIPQEPRTGDYRFIYYLAYYLPSALIGKLSSWQIANHALFLWTLLGVWLSLLWFTKLSRAGNLWVLSLLAVYFVLASGLDSVGYWLIRKKMFVLFSPIEWWSGFWNWSFQANTIGLYWAPQHTLAAWLSSSLLLNAYFFRRTQVGVLVIPFVAALAWSPLVAVGLLPLMGALLGHHKIFDRGQFFAILAALFFLLVFASYYHSLSYPVEWSIYTPQALFSKHLVVRFMLFYFLEVGGYVLLLLHFNHTESKEKIDKLLIFIVVIGLFFVQLVKVGHWNDFCMRASAPCLMVLWVLIGRRLVYFLKTRRLTGNIVLLLVFIILGSLSPLVYIVRSVSHYRICAPNWSKILPVPEIYIKERSFFVPRQYIGKKENSLFFRVFLK